MEIKNKLNKIYFNEVKIGDVFFFDYHYYLKTSLGTAMDLEDNEIIGFNDKDNVGLLNAEIIINN